MIYKFGCFCISMQLLTKGCSLRISWKLNCGGCFASFLDLLLDLLEKEHRTAGSHLGIWHRSFQAACEPKPFDIHNPRSVTSFERWGSFFSILWWRSRSSVQRSLPYAMISRLPPWESFVSVFTPKNMFRTSWSWHSCSTWSFCGLNGHRCTTKQY